MLLIISLFLMAWFTTHYAGGLIYQRLLSLFGLPNYDRFVPLGLSNILGILPFALITGFTHFFYPVEGTLVFVFIVIAIVDFKHTRLFFAYSWQQAKPHLIWLIPALLFSWIAILLRPGIGDIADYHLQHILWSEHYPLVKGLGNFNRPLANNNWWFHIQAIFGFNQWNGASTYVGNALYFFAVLTWFITSPVQNKQHQFMRLIFIAFVVLSLKTAFVGAVTADFIVTLTLYIFLDLFIIGKIDTSKEYEYQLLIFILVCFLVTVKATAITFFMLPLPWLFSLLKEKKFQTILKLVILSLLFFIPYFIGNVILCGYLLYPFNQIDLFNVDWKVPGYYFDIDKVVLKNWAKIPGQDIYVTAKLALKEWLPIWFGNLDLFNKSLLLLFLIAIPFLFYKMIKIKEIRWLTAFLILGFITIFINGPHPRFLFAYMVGSIALALYTLKLRFEPKMGLNFLLGIFLLLGGFQSYQLFSQTNWRYVWVQPKPYPKCTMESKEINGFKFSKTNMNNTCWDQFPATYYFIDSVTLRTNEVKDGFKVIGTKP